MIFFYNFCFLILFILSFQTFANNSFFLLVTNDHLFTIPFFFTNQFILFLPEIFFLINLFVVFFFFLLKKTNKNNFMFFSLSILNLFFFYFCSLVYIFFFKNFFYNFSFFNGLLKYSLIANSFRLILCFFCFVYICLFILDCWLNQFLVIELLFLLSILFWIFFISLLCFNLFFLFLIMESITLLLVIIFTIYISFVNPKIVKTIIHFFILNITISSFFLLGLVLLLYIVPYNGVFTLSYSIFNYLIIFFSHGAWKNFQLDFIWYYFKILFFTVTLLLLPLLFKLTLIPFSIWIINIYTKLPYLLLLLLMTIYKISFFGIFINLFILNIDLSPFFTNIWQIFTYFFVLPSFFIGCLAYRSQNLKIVFAFTTISQIAYIFLGLLSVHQYRIYSSSTNGKVFGRVDEGHPFEWFFGPIPKEEVLGRWAQFDSTRLLQGSQEYDEHLLSEAPDVPKTQPSDSILIHRDMARMLKKMDPEQVSDWVFDGNIIWNSIFFFTILYLIFYCLHIFGIFSIFILLQKKYSIYLLNQIFFIKIFNKKYYSYLVIFFFSLAGIPPFFGFFTKFFLFLFSYWHGSFSFVFIAIISNFFMSIIYLQILIQLIYKKKIYFNLPLLGVELTKKNFNFYYKDFYYKKLIFYYNKFFSFLYYLNIFSIFFFTFLFYIF